MDRYIIYGMIEPDTRKIVYIDFYVEDIKEKFYTELANKDFLEVSLDTMKDEGNYYNRDLINMWNEGIEPYNNKTSVVVLDILNNDNDIYERMDAYKKLFKPKFNLDYYNNSEYTYILDKGMHELDNNKYID